jgi:hypothetical protein
MYSENDLQLQKPRVKAIVDARKKEKNLLQLKKLTARIVCTQIRQFYSHARRLKVEGSEPVNLRLRKF